MISNRTIICLASGWDYHPTSKHHVMRKLAETNSIIWVNWHASRRPSAGLSDLRSVIGKLGEIRQGARRVSESISVVTPCQLPLPGSGLVRRLNARMVYRAIVKVLDTLPKRPIQLWSFAPDVAELVGRFGEELALYYCVDAFGEFPGYDRGLIEQRERELIRKCDVVITTSPPLHDAKRQLHPNVHLVEHGVDHGHLSRALRGDMPPAAELRSMSKPVLGFVGVIGNWVDLGLVAGLARAWPEASIVMLGPEATSRGPCAGLPNVHWLGPRNHETLPSYLSGFDVGLIPFKNLPLTYNANPIKLYEYLAAGVPVVSTTLPAVRQADGSVWLADDVTDLVNGCRDAARRNSPAERIERSRLMLSESWTARLEHISGIVASAMKERTASRPSSAMSPAERIAVARPA